jgi:polysaccharide transporter, PST family
MGIVKVGLYSVGATAARLVAGLLVMKLVAWFSGPVGVAKLGQFMSLMSFLTVLAGGGIGSGIVKYVAEYKADSEKLGLLLNTAFCFVLAASCLMGLGVLLFSQSISLWLLGEIRYESLIWVLAVAQLVIALHNYVVAIINGFMDIRRVTLLHIAGSTLAIAITVLLAYFFQLYGALLALVIGQAAMLLVSLPVFLGSPYFSRGFFRLRYDAAMTIRLAKFSAMTLTSALLPPLVHIWVRNYLATEFSWEEVGYWQAVSKVSEAYLMFITMAISVYYMPMLSSITDRERFKAEVRTAYRYILPVVAMLAAAIYSVREWVTILLFSEGFAAANSLYGAQLLGDVIKVASFILSYVMLAKAMTTVFILSEVVFSVTYVSLVYFLTGPFGLIGAMYAFVINYLIYFAFTAFVARSFIRRM